LLKPRSVLEALSALGIDGKEDGAGEMNLPCPLHNGRGNNFGINLETGVWICRSQCGGGNLRQLASKLGRSELELQHWPASFGSGVNLTAPPPTILDEYDEAAWVAVTREPPESELRRRGIDPRIAAELGIRFNPWNPKPDLKQGPKSDPAWMIPLRHPTEHRMIGWQVKGTVTGSAVTTGKKNATLFGIELVDPEQPLIVVESPLDVAVMMTAGLRNVVATFGTSIGVQHIQIIADLDPVELIEGMDNDESGRKAAKKLLGSRVLRPIPKKHFFYLTDDPEEPTYRKDPGDMTAQEILDGAHHAYV
jgi:hypothetical protein